MRETIRCTVQGIYLMPKNIAHIQVAADGGDLWVETDHAAARMLRLDDRLLVNGERHIERTVTFLINTKIERLA